MSNEAKPTPGPWKVETLGAMLRAVKIHGDKALRITPPAGPAFAYLPEGATDIQSANARLIAEAGTVYHETGLTPRQLAEQRAELLEALKALLWPNVPSSSDVALLIRMCGTEKSQEKAMPLVEALEKAQDAARAAIAKAEGKS